MEIEDFSFHHHHPMGDSATHPMEPLTTRLAALLLLVDRSPLRRRAYPDTSPAAHSGASN